MSAPSLSPVFQSNLNTTKIHFSEAINLLVQNFDGRVLVSTRFTPEDQVLTHLITKNNLPVRLVTTSGDGNYDILHRTVEHYGKNIEVLNRQTVSAITTYAALYPEHYEQIGTNPSTAPLTQILAGKHVIVSGLRKEQFSNPAEAKPFAWDETQRKFRYYPLFYWTSADVKDYILRQNIPYVSGSLQPASTTRPHSLKINQAHPHFVFLKA